MRIRWIVLLVALVTGCDRPAQQTAAEETATPPAPSTSPAAPAVEAPPPETPVAPGATLQTAEGRYDVRYVSDPDPIPLNDLLAFDVVVTEQGKPVDAEVTLLVDAAMPGHGHGMNTVPKAEALGDGRFRAEGLMLHMAGYWEVYFDVTRDGVTERAQFNLELE